MADPRQDDMPVFTDEELDAMSVIGPEDVERALLDATPTDEER